MVSDGDDLTMWDAPKPIALRQELNKCNDLNATHEHKLGYAY